MAPPCKYNNAEDRIEAYKEQQNNYSMKNWNCEICDCVIRLGNKTNHLNSMKHFNHANEIDPMPKREKIKLDPGNVSACDIEIHIHSKNNHLKSARHIRNTMKE